MPARAVVLPEEQGVDALRHRLARLTATRPVLVAACRGPVGTIDEVVRSGVRFDNLLVLDAKPLERPVGPPDVAPTLYSFGPTGQDLVSPRPQAATVIIDDLPSLFAQPDPQDILDGVRKLTLQLFPAAVDVEYVVPRGMVPPEAKRGASNADARTCASASLPPPSRSNPAEKTWSGMVTHRGLMLDADSPEIGRRHPDDDIDDVFFEDDEPDPVEDW